MTGAVVVPCYNEAARIEPERFLELSRGGFRVLFVDDGSTDETRALLERFSADHGGAAQVFALERNSGKAEAVRRGLLAGLESGAEVVGYLDADLATPPGEMLRIFSALAENDVALGSRVALLGRRIQRSAHRHVLGRAFATFASLALDMPVYDTQCGAKAFRDTPALRAALQRPFSSRWAFDVELLGRLLAPEGAAALSAERFVEVPLGQWIDVKGSKLKPAHMLRAGLDLLAIGANHRRRSP